MPPVVLNRDIYRLVLLSCGPATLLRCARVSREFYDLAHPLLYRHLHLRPTLHFPTVRGTLAKLQEATLYDRTVVTTLVLDGVNTSNATNERRVILDACVIWKTLRELPRLRALALRAIVFKTCPHRAEERHVCNFGGTMQQLPQLELKDLVCTDYANPLVLWYNAGAVRSVALRHIEWGQAAVLRASETNTIFLHTLCIDFSYVGHRAQDTIRHLPNIHVIDKLSLLSVGPITAATARTVITRSARSIATIFLDWDPTCKRVRYMQLFAN